MLRVLRVLRDQGLRGYDGPSGSEEADFTDFISDSRDGIVLVGDTGSRVRISHSEIITAQYVVGTQTTDSVTIKGIGKVLATIKGYETSISDTTPIITYGRVGVRWNIIPDDISAIQTDAAVTPGMSGGGVFNKVECLTNMGN